MKNILLTIITCFAIVSISYSQSKTAVLKQKFGDEIAMHNVNIAFDGDNYYTINGGNETVGAINKYTKTGDFIASYSINLDMRSIMYNPSDDKLYVSSNDKNIYKVINVKKGTYRLILNDILTYEHASPKLDPKGKYLYVLEYNTVKKYSFPEGKLVETFDDITSGEGQYGGDGAIAVDAKHIYTWNTRRSEVYIHNIKGEYESTVQLNNDADAGFSLSFANNLVFVARDGDGGRGIWYGYTFEKITDGANKGKRKKHLNLSQQFDDKIPMHNFDIVFDGKHYFTINGGNASVGAINKYTKDGTLVESYDIDLDMRSIMYHVKKRTFYVATYGRDIYKISDMKTGDYEKIYENLYDYAQSSPTLDPKGKYMYIMDRGLLKKYNFKTGKVVATFENIKCGSDNYGGAGAVTVTKKNILTWNSSTKTVYVYDLKGKYEYSMDIHKGNCGFSLTYTNNMLFVSIDGEGGFGTWFGYTLDKRKGSKKIKKPSKKKKPQNKERLPEEAEG